MIFYGIPHSPHHSDVYDESYTMASVWDVKVSPCYRLRYDVYSDIWSFSTWYNS